MGSRGILGIKGAKSFYTLGIAGVLHNFFCILSALLFTDLALFLKKLKTSPGVDLK